MNTRNKEKIENVDNTIKRKGRGDNVKVPDKPVQSGVNLILSPHKTTKKDIVQSPNSWLECSQHTPKLTHPFGIDSKTSNDVVIMDQNYCCANEDMLDALPEAKFLRPVGKEICNNESPSKQKLYLRTSVVEKIDKRTASQSYSPTREELYCPDGVGGLNEISKKQRLEIHSSKNNITEFHTTECTSDVEFYEMQHSDIMPRTDSPSSFSSDSAGFSSRIPKFREEFGLSILHNQSPCKRGGNSASSPRCKLQRYSSGSSFSSEMSSCSSKNQSKSSPSVCDKWLWHRNKQLSETSCVQNDNQLKQLEKQQPCMSAFFTGTEYVPVPSEAETAPQNPRGEILFGDIVSKMQQKFAEEKRTLSCDWLTPDDFHINTVSVFEQNIEDLNCQKEPCKSPSLMKDYEKLNNLSQLSDGIESTPSSTTNLSTSKKKVKRNEMALLHASLKEISWAKNLNPENMLTTERRPQQRKLRDSTKKKIEDGAQALKMKGLTKKMKINKQTSNNMPKNVDNLKRGSLHSVRKGASLLGGKKAKRTCEKQYSTLSQQKVSQNIKSKQIVKKYMRKTEKPPFQNQEERKRKRGRPMKNDKIILYDRKKQTSNNIAKVGKNKICPKSNNHVLKQLPLNSKYAKHRSDINAGKPLKYSCAEPKHKAIKSSHTTADHVPELRVTLKPLDDINIWNVKKKSEEVKKKHCHYTSKSYRLTTSRGELKARVFHKMKTTWNKITPEQRHHFYSNSGKSDISFGSVKRSTATFSTYRTAKRKRYDEETTRYSIRQSECAFRYKEIAVKKHHNFIQIILVPNRSRQNSLTVEGMKELREALFAACKDPGCRAVLFNSSGSIFCSGIDLSPVIGCTKKVIVEELANSVRELVQTMGSFPKPLVAAVNGMAVGFGVTLLTFCDIVLASDKATFFMPYAKLGYIAEGAATLTLPQVIGATMATDMLLRGRKLTAQEALRCGLVSEVLWPTHLMEEAVPRMQALAAQSLQVMEATKSMIRYHLWEKLQSTLEDECRSLPKQWISSICQQAIRNAMENNILME